MKALLLKDYYMAIKYCKSQLLITLGFVVLSFLNEGNLFFLFYPCIFGGIIPVNLLGYDEKSKWLQYSGTMPYTKAQIVSSKYLVGLIAQALILILTGGAHAVRMIINNTFQLADFSILILMLFILAAVTSSISLPFIFKLGVEKGRAAYYAMIILVCAFSGGATVLLESIDEGMLVNIQLHQILLFISAVGLALYALSWYLSIVFFKKREIH